MRRRGWSRCSAVLNGKAPAMPPWRDKVGDDDVKLLWAYVRSGG